MASANQALNSGIDLLNEHDQFNIIAFDHEQVSFDPGLVLATPEAKGRAHQWIALACQARGLTVRPSLWDRLLDQARPALWAPALVSYATRGVLHDELVLWLSAAPLLALIEPPRPPPLPCRRTSRRR